MMIKSSLYLIFVLLYKSTYLWSESEKRKKFWGVFDYFTVTLDLWNIESFQRLNRASCRGSWKGGGARPQPRPTAKCATYMNSLYLILTK